ncbi:FAD/NAD(P)-binding domain-containing protein [Trichoderma austrokoningii]
MAHEAKQPTKFIIIGAGWAGLVAAKTYLQVKPTISLTIVDLEATVGGVWSKARCYPGFIADGPVGLFDFSDLPMSSVIGLKNWDELPGIKVHEYLHEYARKFNLLERCKFSCRVTNVRRATPDGGWTLDMHTTSDDAQKISETLTCDKLIVATGLFSNPNCPDLMTSEFKGPVMHTKDIGQQYDALLGTNVESVAIYGGGKSAIDALNLCIEAGKKVHWIISDKGSGPNVLFNTRVKGGFHVGQFVGRWKDIFSASIFSVDTFFGRFFYSGENRLGTWLIDKFWSFATKKMQTGGLYAGMTDENREKLLPEGESALFSAAGGAALHSCPRFLPELSKPVGLITVHRARIISAQDQTLEISNNETVSCQALVYGTGWSGEDMIFEPSLGLSLGLPKPVALEDQISKDYWQKLHTKADTDVLSLLPILKDSPGIQSSRATLTPYRLHRYMLPSSLAAQNDRSLVFLGYLISIQKNILSEVSALWAICWLDNLVDLNISNSKYEMDYEIAKVNSWSLQKNLTLEPRPGSGIQHFIDLLMKDMGLKAKRKGRLGIRDTFVPYRSQDYLGIVDEVLQKSKTTV